MADVSQLQQILLNLVVNARDALPNGGKITIKTADVVIDETDEELAPGRYVKLDVRDNGIGINLDTQSRIFEPFFTTKEMGKGTGLGLSTVYGIIKQHKGKIQIESEVNKGTCFNLFLPLLDSKEAPKTRMSTIPPKSLDGTETILVVEDAMQRQKLTSGILERYGYRVLQASNGNEALKVS